MADFHSEKNCKELQSKYLELVGLLEEVIALKKDIKKLKNHPINDFPEAFYFTYNYYCEAKKMQHHILKDVLDYLNDFRSTRNENLKVLNSKIFCLANEILSYDGID